MGSTLGSITSTVSRDVSLYVAFVQIKLYTDKAEVEEYLKNSGLPSATVCAGLLSCAQSVGLLLILYTYYYHQAGSVRTYGSKCFVSKGKLIEILTGFQRLNALSKVADGTYELSIPRYSPTATNALLWVQKDLGGSVLALLKHYQDRADEILNNTFYVANAHITFPGFAKILSKSQFLSFMDVP